MTKKKKVTEKKNTPKAKTPKNKTTALSALNYRQYANSVRTWMYFSMVEAVIIVVLVVTIFGLVPLKETEVRYVEFTGSHDNFFTVYPSNMDKTTAQVLIRKQLRNYVYNREKRDNSTEITRFKEVQAMSDQNVFGKFKELYQKTSKNFEGLNRNIKIVSDAEIQPNVHQIEYVTEDVKDGLGRERSYFATITYEVLPHIVNDETALANPLGINVTKYDISKRERGDK